MALSANTLTTLAAVKEYLQLPESESGKDALYERLIKAASDLLESECRRKFGKAVHTETHYFDDGAGRYVFVRNYPVLSVSGVTDAGGPLGVSEFAACRNRETYVELDRRRSGPIVIVYEAGFVLPKDEDSGANPPVVRTLPYDLEQACIALVQYYYKTDISNFSTVFADSGAIIKPASMPGHVVRIIEKYAKVV